MLQIRHIRKTYKTGDLVQKALDDVSLNLRDNEFVAILGPSGSGKSTLLNIVGGLDRYDEGDLIINGTSTKKYKDRDWDSYRNHTIGFIFQSYNLIPHQTVLANVELALTISGISKTERKKRAEEALRKVGLGDQMHKKPNQMSGGQMQRVAIARALVNNPDILLADEPTGALDTETSVQVMDLLKEVARDRLVVMVTHNPELAEEYASRIVRLKDGHIISDTNPYVPDTEDQPAVHRNLGHASMSLLTALQLSYNNLLTKKARTLLVAFAGSIGIIGIALIMSISNGVNQYIKDTERETLSEYPLTIQKTAMDMSSIMDAEAEQKDKEDETKEGQVREKQTLSTMFSGVSNNDLASLKKYIDTDGAEFRDNAEAIEYSYDLSPLIFLNGDTIHQVNPDVTLSASGIAPTSSVYASSFSMNNFSQLPSDKDLYASQYDVKAGNWPERENEAVVVLNSNGEVTDTTLYTLGIRDYGDLEKMVQAFTNNQNTESEGESGTYSYEDLMKAPLKRVNQADCYTYDETNNIWVDHTSDTSYMKDIVNKAEDLKITGVVQLKDGEKGGMLSPGIAYSPLLTEKILQEAENIEAIKAQLKDSSTNIFTGHLFSEDNEGSSFDMAKLFSVDESAFASAFSMDPSRINMNMEDFMDPSGIQVKGLSSEDLQKVLAKVKINASQENMQEVFNDTLQTYLTYAAKDPSTDYSKLQESISAYLKTDQAKQIISESFAKVISSSDNSNAAAQQFISLMQEIMKDFPAWMQENGYTDPQTAMEAYMQSEEVQKKITDGMTLVLSSITISPEDIEKTAQALSDGYTAYAKENSLPDPSRISSSFAAWLQSEEGMQTMEKEAGKIIDENSLTEAVSSVMQEQAAEVMGQLGNMMEGAMTQMMSQLPSAFSFNPEAIQNAFHFNMDEKELQSLFANMMKGNTVSYEGNLKKLGYGKEEEPSSISIYPLDFEAKDRIKAALDSYNADMKEAGKDEQVITYTDMVGTLMSSVTKIVNTISYVLIAFVAISLIVSSIMIGVITYISVLERRKEIGILRAIGASKRNISLVFDAETLITGFLAGIIGVGIALVLLFPINYVIHMVTDNQAVHASLPALNGLILIVLSVFLTYLGGRIPARKAAKSDPVAALRTE